MCKKIAYIIDQLRMGGTEKQLVGLANRLNRRRFQPIVFTLRDYDNILIDDLECPIYPLGINQLIAPRFFSGLAKFIKLLKQHKIDILQTFFPESTLIGVLGGRLAHVPRIISSRRDMGSWHSLVNRFSIQLSNILIDRVLVNSQAAKFYVQASEKFRKDRIEVIYNGIDIGFFENDAKYSRDLESEKITIGIIANSRRPVKRIDLFIEAMNMLGRRYRDLLFLIVGEFDNSILEMIPSYLRPMYCFTGSVSNVKQYLKNFDIGVICSDSEGFSNVILEYMASSIPTVCTNSGGNPELIDDGINGLLFTKGDVNSLVEKVSVLLEDPSLRIEIAEKAKEKVRLEFNWDKVVKEYETYYEALITNSES